MKKLSLYIFLVLTFSLFTSKSFAVSFEKNCKVPKGSIKTIKIDGEKYTQFTLKDKDKGGCSTDIKPRHGAPYWERAELAQKNTLSKKKIHEISFKVKITEGFNGIRENFFQIHNYNKNLMAVYPSIMLKFDTGNFQELDTGNFQINYLKSFICVKKREKYCVQAAGGFEKKKFKTLTTDDFLNKWMNFKIVISKIINEKGSLTIFINDNKVLDNAVVHFPKKGTPRIKYGIYRPGKLSSEKEFVAIAKNKKDKLFQMKSRNFFFISEAEEDVLKRCKLFFEPYGKNMQKNCFIDSSSEILLDVPILGNNTSQILYSRIVVKSK